MLPIVFVSVLPAHFLYLWSINCASGTLYLFSQPISVSLFHLSVLPDLFCICSLSLSLYLWFIYLCLRVSFVSILYALLRFCSPSMLLRFFCMFCQPITISVIHLLMLPCLFCKYPFSPFLNLWPISVTEFLLYLCKQPISVSLVHLSVLPIFFFYLFSLALSVFVIVTANWLKSLNGTLFSHVWRRGRLALDPLQK